MEPVKGQARVIAIEEHFWDPEVVAQFDSLEGRSPDLQERLYDLGALRLREMDEAGIDLQVISHGAPSTQRLAAEVAIPLARAANDRLHAVVRAHPDRFAAFAVLPTADPAAAADELERAVSRLGFKGAMIHGHTNGVFHDDQRFRPIFRRAQALDVPIYLHPAVPQRAVAEVYFDDYVKDYPMLARAAWGYALDTATQAIRMVVSGLFDDCPDLKIILGHMGEALPFSLWRIDQALSRKGNRPIPFRDLFCEHFWITTSGNFSTPALLCSVMEMGVDRILFSVDWPFVENRPGVEWMAGVPLSAADRAKILHGNAARLLRL
jgi:predicted TIM-barrel fold metal-dependent hydrolase